MAVKSPPLETVERVRVTEYERRVATITRREPANLTVELARCPRCVERRNRARSILGQNPRMARALGAADYALDFIDSALTVFDVLGMKRRDVDSLTATQNDVELLIHERTMPALGALATWGALVAPVMRFGIQPDSCVPSRWGHLRESDLQPMRDGLGALLLRHTESRGPQPIPNGGLPGCLFCGIATVDGFPREAAELWAAPVRVNPGTLGGHNRPEPLYGHLCPECRSETDKVGVVGITAMERAFTAHLGVTLREGEGLRGLRAWGVLREGTVPNRIRWAHVAGQSAFRDHLQDPEREIPRTRLG